MEVATVLQYSFLGVKKQNPVALGSFSMRYKINICVGVGGWWVVKYVSDKKEKGISWGLLVSFYFVFSYRSDSKTYTTLDCSNALENVQ